MNMRKMARFTSEQCIQSQVHLGHTSSNWNPDNSGFLLGKRKHNYIFDIRQTLLYLHRACNLVREVSSVGGHILFVGRSPKVLAGKGNPYEELIRVTAESCGHSYSISHWRNGNLTNWKNRIAQWLQAEEKSFVDEPLSSQSIKNLYTPGDFDFQWIKANASSTSNSGDLFTSLDLSLGTRLSPPDLIFVLGSNSCSQIIDEAYQVGIPVVAIVDSNLILNLRSKISYPIPGNDSSLRAAHLYCSVIAAAIHEGQSLWLEKDLHIFIENSSKN